MGKNEKTPITVNDKEYFVEDFTEQQKGLLSHIENLTRKADNTQYNLDELLVGRQGYIKLLADSLETETPEEAEVVN